jgi:hypothetical protein
MGVPSPRFQGKFLVEYCVSKKKKFDIYNAISRNNTLPSYLLPEANSILFTCPSLLDSVDGPAVVQWAWLNILCCNDGDGAPLDTRKVTFG